MNFFQYITAVLLSLEPAYIDRETWVDRTTRMEVISQAINDAASRATCSDKYDLINCKKTWSRDKKSLAILLVTKGYWESHFSKNVHQGKCRSYECDVYKTTNGNLRHLARSPWQIQKTKMVTKQEYALMNSSNLESTTMSANVATRYLINGMNICNTINGTIAIYGGAKSCNWTGAKHRTFFYEKLINMPEIEIVEQITDRKLKLEKHLKTFPINK